MTKNASRHPLPLQVDTHFSTKSSINTLKKKNSWKALLSTVIKEASDTRVSVADYSLYYSS